MSRSATVLLSDILEAAGLLAKYTSGLTLSDLAENIEKQDSVARDV